jgi:hypothetical protein
LTLYTDPSARFRARKIGYTYDIMMAGNSLKGGMVFAFACSGFGLRQI